MNANPASADASRPPFNPWFLARLNRLEPSLSCRACAPIAPALSANLRDQLLRASSSAVLNTAEGFGSMSRGVKRRHYEIARGSATECVAILDLAIALGLQDDVAASRALLTRAAMMLSKLEGRSR